MNVFIHTFSLSVNITYEELSKLYIYRWMPLDNAYKGKKYMATITEFCKEGLQLQIKERTNQEIIYDKEHRPLRMDLIVTPYKLLHPDKCLGKITEIQEMKKAIKALEILIDKVQEDTGILIRRNLKIERVDITCDVVTPSDEYSKEIIAVFKTIRLPYGYHRSILSEEDIDEYCLKSEDGSLFYNKSQNLFAKVYDKKENIKNREEYQEFQKEGLVRYEIELTRKYLKQAKILENENVYTCILNVMQFAEDIFMGFLIDAINDMPMLSGKVLNDYLELKYSGKEKTLEKLRQFSKMAFYCKKRGLEFSPEQCGMSHKAFHNCYKKFIDMGISPIPLDDACPYIPSVESMLNEEIEKKWLRYAQKKTRGKELWY